MLQLLLKNCECNTVPAPQNQARSKIPFLVYEAAAEHSTLCENGADLAIYINDEQYCEDSFYNTHVIML